MRLNLMNDAVEQRRTELGIAVILGVGEPIPPIFLPPGWWVPGRILVPSVHDEAGNTRQ